MEANLNFNFLDLFTRYKFEYLGGGDGSYMDNFERKEAACFATFFRQAGNDSNYDSRITISIGHTLKWNSKHRNNFMLLTFEELEYYLGELKKVVDFDHEIVKSNSSFDIILTIRDKSHFEQKWIISSVRNVYEYPQNVSIKEAVALKRAGYFKFEDNIINIFNTIVRTLVERIYDQIVSSFHRLRTPKHLTIDQLKSQINKLKSDYRSELNDIYTPVGYKEQDENISGKIRIMHPIFINGIPQSIDKFYTKMNLDARYKLIYKPLHEAIKKISI